MSRLHFNYSISHYPRTVQEIMAEAVPWTIGLLGTTTLLSLIIGTLLGISFAILDYFGETNHIVPIVPRQPQLR